MLVSKQFRKSTILNRTVHVLENINIPVPFRDWDHDEEEEAEKKPQVDIKVRIEQYKQRYTRVEREMIGLYIINTMFMAIMMVPLWYTVIQIRARHHFLQWLILTTKEEENLSYSIANKLNIWISISMVVLCILEIFLYFFYNKKLHPWVQIIKNSKESAGDKVQE